MEHRATIPMLRSFDEDKARGFYCGFLGFSVDFEHRFAPGMPLFMSVSRGTITFWITEHHGDATPGAHVAVKVTGLAAFHRALSASDYPNMRPGLDDHIGGGKVVAVTDPFGNRIDFIED
ncbi:glyoxalase superfamily protein [Pelagibacterium montanilacus]|uniref:glyoxalase superfamily protein n=1 Tax=Pelagibacterium montanilacus TaxID=2185280 RepID=UPI000F8CF16F|nr:glyoxalase superfamily protein [Pelagibacterium montanilacus]